MNGGEFIISTTDTNVTNSGDINDGEWHHLTATYNVSEMRHYVDGVLV